MSATGACLPPLIIFRGKTIQQQWFLDSLGEYKSWKFTTSPNGWTLHDISC